MGITTLMLYISIVAVIWTLGISYFTKQNKNLLTTFIQSFCGLLFIFSGWVKAVDPLGTSFKMEEYFGEFYDTFSGTWLDFAADIFPYLSSVSIVFSVVTIVLEIVIGIMLVIGAKPKFTAWTFLILMIFFTKLTGFTYLTGYVPEGKHFFEISEWGPYVKENMKVQDCGCFGDFIKLEPKVSFMKDLFLLIPSLFLVFSTKQMYQLFDKSTRNVVVFVSIIALIWYCMSNYSWNLPQVDFRPFKEGVNIKERRQAEIDATKDVQIKGFDLLNTQTEEKVYVSYADYMKNYKNYPSDIWETVKQYKTEPTLVKTKLSDFYIIDDEGNDLTDTILGNPGYSLMWVSYEFPVTTEWMKVNEMDSVLVRDTIPVDGEIKIVESVVLHPKSIEKPSYSYEDKYLEACKDHMVPLADAMKAVQVPSFLLLSGSDDLQRVDFKKRIAADFPIYVMDELVLKTIIRSNPGLVLLHNGVVEKKWHINQLPSAEHLKKVVQQ